GIDMDEPQEPEPGIHPHEPVSVVPDLRAIADGVVYYVAFLVVAIVKLLIDVMDDRSEVSLHRIVRHRPLTKGFHTIVNVRGERFLHPLGRPGPGMSDDGLGGFTVPWRPHLAQIV